MAQYVANTIMAEIDRQDARERNQNNKTIGKTRRERIMAITKKLTAGKLVLDGRSYHLDQNVLDQVKRKQEEIILLVNQKRQKQDLEYLQMCFIADNVLKKYNGIEVNFWRKKEEIVAVLKPLKVFGDPPLPTNRKDAEERYREWSNRNRRSVDSDISVDQKFEEWKLTHNQKMDE